MEISKPQYRKLENELESLIKQESEVLKERIEEHFAEIVHDFNIDLATRHFVDLGLTSKEFDWFEGRILKESLKGIRQRWIRSGN